MLKATHTPIFNLNAPRAFSGLPRGLPEEDLVDILRKNGYHVVEGAVEVRKAIWLNTHS